MDLELSLAGLLIGLGATGSLLVGSIPGILIDGHFTVRIADRALRVVLASTLTLAGVKLLDPPGADGLVVAGAGVAASAALVALVRALRRRRLDAGVAASVPLSSALRPATAGSGTRRTDGR